MANTVLVYRIGSIGDTVIALPALKLIGRSFPDARRILLTNFPGRGEAPLKSILGDMSIVHDYIEYPLSLRDPQKLWTLRAQIRSLRVDTLVYLTPRTTRLQVLRDLAYFRACGISRIIGAPISSDLRSPRFDSRTRLWEAEGVRLARCVEKLGDPHLDDLRSWSLELTDVERTTAREVLCGWEGAAQFITVVAGAKIGAKDWSVHNWTAVVSQLGCLYPKLGLALIGSAEERERAAGLAALWSGPTINLCGKLTPRLSAAVMEHAILFVGHDGGPMHLAASVGVPVVAVFSGRDHPGIWFPHQPGAEILYPEALCYCGHREDCVTPENKCILTIRPEHVIAESRMKLDALGFTGSVSRKAWSESHEDSARHS